MQRLAAELRYLTRLRVRPPRVAWFDWRAGRLAWRIDDPLSLVSATRTQDLAALLKLPHDRRHVVELGTGTGWTAIEVPLDDPMREVLMYDPIYREERERYVTLVDPGVRVGIAFVAAGGESRIAWRW